ncbi:MAG: hypothetical protein H7318_00870 [Oligoflexus sp.]|nr:hypothetical protein [Oligoflexus sp.]
MGWKVLQAGCTTHFSDDKDMWNCRDFDSELKIKVSTTGPKTYEALVTDQDPYEKILNLGTMACGVPKS